MGLKNVIITAEKVEKVVSATLNAKGNAVTIKYLVTDWRICCETNDDKTIAAVKTVEQLKYSSPNGPVPQREATYVVNGLKGLGITNANAMQYATEAVFPDAPGWWHSADSSLGAACLAAQGPNNFLPNPNKLKWTPGKSNPDWQNPPPK